MSYPARPSPVNSLSNSSGMECKQWEKCEENGCKGPEREALEPLLFPGDAPRQQVAVWGRSAQNGALVAKRRRFDDDEEEMVMVEALPAEDCEAYGRSVAAQLRQMPHMQKCLAQRLISEVCFRGQMQFLHMSTTLATQPPVPQPPVPQQPVPQHFYPSRGNPNPGFGRGDIVMQAARPMQQQQQQYPNFAQQQQPAETAASSNLNHAEM